MKPVTLDADGHIAITDGMSDELKEKIAEYNRMADDNSSDENEEAELSDEQVDSVISESASENPDNEFLSNFEDDDDDETGDEGSEEETVSEEDLNNLNDLFQ